MGVVVHRPVLLRRPQGEAPFRVAQGQVEWEGHGVRRLLLVAPCTRRRAQVRPHAGVPRRHLLSRSLLALVVPFVGRAGYAHLRALLDAAPARVLGLAAQPAQLLRCIPQRASVLLPPPPPALPIPFQAPRVALRAQEVEMHPLTNRRRLPPLPQSWGSSLPPPPDCFSGAQGSASAACALRETEESQQGARSSAWRQLPRTRLAHLRRGGGAALSWRAPWIAWNMHLRAEGAVLRRCFKRAAITASLGRPIGMRGS